MHGKPVLQRDLLRAQVLLDRHRVVGAALDRRVVGDDRRPAAVDPADAGDDPAPRRVAVVELLGGERAELEERGARVAQRARPARAAAACRGRCGAARARSPPPARTRCQPLRLSSAMSARCPLAVAHSLPPPRLVHRDERLAELDAVAGASASGRRPCRMRGAVIDSSIFIDSSTSSTSPSSTVSPSADADLQRPCPASAPRASRRAARRRARSTRRAYARRGGGRRGPIADRVVAVGVDRVAARARRRASTGVAPSLSRPGSPRRSAVVLADA